MYRLLMRKPEGKRPLGRQDIGRCIILGQILERWDGGCGLDWSGPGQGQVESSCAFGIEPLSSIKCWETIEWSNNWWPFQHFSAS
jgi:hypothetical protein